MVRRVIKSLLEKAEKRKECASLSVFLSLYFSLSLSFSLFLSLSLSLSFSLFLSLSHFLSLSFSFSFSLTFSLSSSLSALFFLSQSLSLTVSLFLSLIYRELPYEFGPRREGDISTCYADPNKYVTNILHFELLFLKNNLAIVEVYLIYEFIIMRITFLFMF